MRPDAPILKEDGRQSPAARAIQRGVLRYLARCGVYGVTEFPLASGRRADVIALDARGEVTIIEIKSCLADFRVDQKWPEYRAWCDRLLFAVAPDFPVEVLPQETGLLLADGFGGELVRPAPHHPLAAATRKALLIRLGRVAAGRLSALYDPDMARDEFF